jgi:hypothetical protein
MIAVFLAPIAFGPEWLSYSFAAAPVLVVILLLFTLILFLFIPRIGAGIFITSMVSF